MAQAFKVDNKCPIIKRERIPCINLVHVDPVTVFIQKEKKRWYEIMMGLEVVNTLLDLEEEIGLLKKNAISGG